MISRSISFALATMVFVPPLGSAQDATARFTIDTATQIRTGCVLLALDADGTAHLQDGAERRMLPGCIELRQEGRKLPPLLTRAFVSLTNGDRLPLAAGGLAVLAQTKLRVWPAAALPGFDKGLDLFAPNVVLLFYSVPDGVDDAEAFYAKLDLQIRKRDVAYLKNGDTLEGTLSALDNETGCTMVVGARKVHTPREKLAGIAFNTERQARLKTKKPYARAVLDGGARINLLDLRFDEKSRKWHGKPQFGAAIELPEAALLAFDLRQGSAIDLSDLTPVRYEHRPYLGATWTLRRDAAATGSPLRLAGNTFEKGLGTHAACQAAYKLDAQYQRFDALVGIDERSRRGRARVAIDLDGKRVELNDGKELTHESPPVSVRLDVRGVRVMTLIVDLGAFGDVQADVNWAKARLIKK